MFSHFFARLGEDFVIETGVGSFESVKVYLFLALLLIATLEVSRKYWTPQINKWFFGSLVIFLLILFLVAHENIRDFLFGIWEKQHAILMGVWLIWLYHLLRWGAQDQKKILKNVILITGVIVSVIALIEYISGYSVFLWLPISTERAISTLGNPNYLAGYLLMLLPLAWSLENIWRKYGTLIILYLGIIISSSVIGITLASFFILWLFLRKFFGGRKWFFVFLFLAIIGIIMITNLSESDKWLSLVSRFVLMRETLKLSIESVLHIMMWYGPNAIISMYDWVRSTIINAYFPQDMIIDSSHNIWIDIGVKYGLITLSALIFFLVKVWRDLTTEAKSGVILGLAFLSLNVAVISHYILFVYFLSEKKWGK
jgi:hypothetical protein